MKFQTQEVANGNRDSGDVGKRGCESDTKRTTKGTAEQSKWKSCKKEAKTRKRDCRLAAKSQSAAAVNDRDLNGDAPSAADAYAACSVVIDLTVPAKSVQVYNVLL